uniref:Putative secreted protein n=1 Tax=Anopheles marajoara TaxID=58244 RepID=A0A2M4CAL1_9DIPT
MMMMMMMMMMILPSTTPASEPCWVALGWRARRDGGRIGRDSPSFARSRARSPARSSEPTRDGGGSASNRKSKFVLRQKCGLQSQATAR